MTFIPHPIASAARGCPDGLALVCPDTMERFSWRQMADAVARRAGALAAGGVEAGQHVALAGVWTSGWVITCHALGWLGATAVLLPPDDADRLKALEVLEPDHVIDVDDARIEALELGVQHPEPSWGFEQPLVVIFTSGSTGRPRPVTLTVGQCFFGAMGSALRLGHLPGDQWLCCLPLHHIGGLSILLRTAFYGTTTVLHRRFDAQAVAAALDGGEITHISLVPAMLQRVLDARPAQPLPQGLRAILLGGAAAPASLLKQAQALGAPVSTTWGMTESAAQVATSAPGEIVIGEVGPPLPFAVISEVTEGPDSGALQIHGPAVAGGHLVTGDRGHVTAEGRVVVHGRRDGVIISGGENIDPVEIEQRLLAHTHVAEAVVVPVASAQWGQRPGALLVPAEGVEDTELPTTDALRAWCRELLPGFKVPDRFLWHHEPPRSALGKPLRPAIVGLLQALDEAQATEAVEQELRERPGLEGRHVDGHVHHLHRGVGGAVGATDVVVQREGTLSESAHGEGDVQGLPHAHGLLVVGAGVHHRGAEAQIIEGGDQALALGEGGPELFVDHMTVFEHTPEKGDARSVHFVESGGDHPLESSGGGGAHRRLPPGDER